jgi:branched-chain amino acid transport system permease protein
MVSADLLVQVVVSGVLIGFVFALISVGLTLIFGVMDIVNFAHGEFLMLAMFAAFWLYSLFGVDPVFSVLVCGPLLFIVGVLTHKILIRHILNAPMLAQIFCTFGLSVFLKSLAQFLWGPNFRSITEPLLGGRVEIFGVFFGLPQVAAALGAVLATGAVYLLIYRTELGRALQATSEDRETAALMGIDTERMFTLAWGIGAACVGVAGALLSMFYYIYPEVGAVFALTSYVVVALGGFGSVTGALIGGLIIGLVQVVAGFITPAFKMVVVYLVYMGVILWRPQGLFGRW